jgi:SMC interacting uncharacterized protein involved in chromosome segregation
MQKKVIVEYDETKKMLNTLRRLNENKTSMKSLREQVESGINTEPTKTDINVINDVDVKITSSDNSDMVLTDNEKTTISGLIDSFREQVSQIADLDPGVTIGESQIRLDGTISDLDINFVFIAGEESGFYINSDMLMVHSEVMETLEKLFKFEEIFKDTIEPIIRRRKTN